MQQRVWQASGLTEWTRVRDTAREGEADNLGGQLHRQQGRQMEDSERHFRVAGCSLV